jgi:phosphate uptake regulator
MESRKVQESASGSFFVTLPKSWVQSTGIKKGAQISVSIDEDGSLRLLSAENNKKTVEYTLNIEEKIEPTLLERRIINCYTHGCDIINIISRKTITQERKRQIKNSVIDLIGMEVSDEFSNKVTIRVLVDPLKFPLREIMRRLCILVSSMHKDAIISLRDADPELALDVIEREKEVNKLHKLMLRQLMLGIVDNRICVESTKDCVIDAIASKDLSRMAFYAADMAMQVANLKGEKIERVMMGSLINLSNVAIEMQQKAIQSFFNDDFALANSVIDRIEWIREFDHDITEKILDANLESKTAMALTTISKDIRRIASYASSIADGAQMRLSL